MTINYERDLIHWLIPFGLNDAAMAISTLERLRTHRCLVHEVGQPSGPNAEGLENSRRAVGLQFILEGQQN